jgi:hypothetical protein
MIPPRDKREMVGREQAGAVPLHGQPAGIAGYWLVGRQREARPVESCHDLLHQGCLADLACAGHHLQKAAGFAQAAGQDSRVRSLEARGQ